MTATITANSAAAPFVKWAGGKRQLLEKITNRMPESYRGYFEPFIGGGAVFFALEPSRAVLNDINKSLVNAYVQIRDNTSELEQILTELDVSHAVSPREFYYKSRDMYNSLIASNVYDVLTAAYLIYLNKHCFNGLYRVNAKGAFNVPFNNSVAPSFTVSNLENVANALQDATFLNGDFEVAVADAKERDFVFLDSPYVPLNPDSFTSYTKEGFELCDHERLARLFRVLDERGCFCMLTNHDTDLIRDLYSGYNIESVTVRRAINSDSQHRTGVEVIVTNYRHSYGND